MKFFGVWLILLAQILCSPVFAERAEYFTFVEAKELEDGKFLMLRQGPNSLESFECSIGREFHVYKIAKKFSEGEKDEWALRAFERNYFCKRSTHASGVVGPMGTIDVLNLNKDSERHGKMAGGLALGAAVNIGFAFGSRCRSFIRSLAFASPGIIALGYSGWSLSEWDSTTDRSDDISATLEIGKNPHTRETVGENVYYVKLKTFTLAEYKASVLEKE